MSCTCFSKKLPCPIHGDKGLPVPEVVNFQTIVIKAYRRWSTTEDWFGTICQDAIRTYQSNDFKTKDEMMNDIKDHL
jgi:hypothetical protein